MSDSSTVDAGRPHLQNGGSSAEESEITGSVFNAGSLFHKGRDLLSGKVSTVSPHWLPTAIFISQRHEYRGKDRALSSWKSRLKGTVETLSPIGEEQTRWSFLRDCKQNQAFLFMTSQKSLQQEVGKNESQHTRFWYPGALAILSHSAKEREWKFLKEDHCISAVLCQKGETLPLQIISRFYNPDQGDEGWRVLYAQMKRELSAEPDPKVLLSPLYRVKESLMSVDASRLKLDWELWSDEEGKWVADSPTTLRNEYLNTGNLKPLTPLEQREVEESRFNRRAWWGLLVLLVTLLFFGGLHLEGVYKKSRNDHLEKEIKGRQAQVEKVEAANTELAFLRGLERERGNLFDWLNVLNYNRPETVVFENFRVREGRLLTVRGNAKLPGNLTVLREGLESTGEFSKIVLTTGKSDQAGTGFTLELEGVRYKPLWAPPKKEESQEPAPVEETEKEQTEETTSIDQGSDHKTS